MSHLKTVLQQYKTVQDISIGARYALYGDDVEELSPRLEYILQLQSWLSEQLAAVLCVYTGILARQQMGTYDGKEAVAGSDIKLVDLTGLFATQLAACERTRMDADQEKSKNEAAQN